MKWNPTIGGYEKTCPICQRDFVGRKNRVYCSTRCKTKCNNEIQLERRYADRQVTEPLLRNIEILKKELSERNEGMVTLPIERLRHSGFDSEAPRTNIFNRSTGERWQRFGDYAICPDEEKQLVTITRINNHE